jgi:hypothetical protein
MMMLDKKGYTLVETLMSLAIVIIIVCFVLKGLHMGIAALNRAEAVFLSSCILEKYTGLCSIGFVDINERSFQDNGASMEIMAMEREWPPENDRFINIKPLKIAKIIVKLPQAGIERQAIICME